MKIDIVTIFPEYFTPLKQALLGKAIDKGILSVDVHDLRDYAHDVHRSVDDSPYGGGPGMVMTPTVWGEALDAVVPAFASTAAPITERDTENHSNDSAADADAQLASERSGGVNAPLPSCWEEGFDPDIPLLIIPTPAGHVFNEEMAQHLSREKHVIFACGRYEGIDSRVAVDASRRMRVLEVSIGDYVLIGGEVAVLVMAEAAVRLIPGVLGNQRSHEEDSFSNGLLEGPCYTRPPSWRGLEIPDVLTSGDHARVDRWHLEESLKRTAQYRPELLDTADISKEDRDLARRWLEH